MTRIPSTTVYNILSKRLRFISRKCRFIPHALTDTLRADRLAKSIELLQILTRAEQTNWRFILTGDESWFFYYPANSGIWLPPDAETPEVARQLINTPKIMVTVFWNPTGLSVNRLLENSTSFNSAYFIEYVIGDIEYLPALQSAIGQKKRVVLHRHTVRPELFETIITIETKYSRKSSSNCLN
jgi:hypothetical protein